MGLIRVTRLFGITLLSAFCFQLSAQTTETFTPEGKPVRFVCNNNAAVRTGGTTGSVIGYHVPGNDANDGKSWATAKATVQDAIDDLVGNNLSGEVWIAEGVYKPTESTETIGGNSYNLSFKIPVGITVRGGFKGRLTENQGSGSVVYDGEKNSATYNAASNPNGREMLDRSTSSAGESMKYRTVLTGQLGDTPATFTWNSTTQRFDTRFYNNAYHVVFFATNGFDGDGHAKPLGTKAELEAADGELAKLECCLVQYGNAQNADIEGHPHTAYGGGIYMVPGAVVENCYINHCEASRNGGGVYMDGGGIFRHNFVVDCQALGTTVDFGCGGALCVESFGEIYPSKVYRSAFINNVASYGGGVASLANKTTLTGVSKTRYFLNNGFSANLISNNTAIYEGGGAYVWGGGSFTHATIVKNKCNGTGAIILGVTTGVSAGLFVDGSAVVANSVLWGGSNATGTNAQLGFANTNQDVKTQIVYTGVSNLESVNWTGVTKREITNLSLYNNADGEHGGGVKTSDEMYPFFQSPDNTAGYVETAVSSIFTPGGFSYMVNYCSGLTSAGVLSRDLDTESITPVSDVCHDIQGNEFSSFPTLGAYITIQPTFNSLIEDGKAHLFVDPEKIYLQEYSSYGDSWEKPIRFLQDALSIITTDIRDQLIANNVSEVQIHIKEGSLGLNGTHSSGAVRTISLEIPELKINGANIPITILGSYKGDLTGTSTATRNPVLYPTVVSGLVMDDYQYYMPHIFTIENRTGVTIDGIQVRYANATSRKLGNDETTGGAFTIKNSTVALKNVLVAGCSATEGAAVYARNGSTVTMENCIMHNNDACSGFSGQMAVNPAGVVSCDRTSSVTLNHCDVIRNVGYAFNNSGTATLENSIFYANMNQKLAETNGQGANTLNTLFGTGAFKSTGKRNLFDSKTTSTAATYGVNTLSLTGGDTNYPLFQNPTRNSGVSEGGDATYYGRATSFMPLNTNPMVNAAAYSGAHGTWGSDMSGASRDFGGLPDVGAVENRYDPESDNPYLDGQLAYGKVLYVRDYGTDMSTTGRDGSSWQNAVNGNANYTTAAQEITVQQLVNAYEADADIPATPEAGYQYTFSSTYQGNAKYMSYNGSLTTYNEHSASTVQNQTSGTIVPGDAATSFVFKKTGSHTSFNGKNYWTYNMYDFTNGRYVCAYTFTRRGNTNEGDRTFASASLELEGYDKFGLHKSGTFTPDNNNPFVVETGDYPVTPSEFIIIKKGDKVQIIPSNATVELGMAFNGTFVSDNHYSDADHVHSLGLNTLDDASTEWTMAGSENAVASVQHTIEASTTKGLQHAINTAHNYFLEEGATESAMHEVYVGAGTYKLMLTTQDGVNVYGGFPASGNPGMNERNISNTADDYKTIIDAEKNGRTLTQAEGFSVPCLFEGFIIQNGKTVGDADNYLNHYNRGGGVAVLANGIIKNCLIQNNEFNGADFLKRFGGGGLYMGAGSTVKNCIIKGNVVHGTEYNGATEGGYKIFAIGGGAYLGGGELINSLIVENNIDKQNSFVLGAAGYIGQKTLFYNCTVAYNFADNGENTDAAIAANHYPATGGFFDDSARPGISEFYNCIFWGNAANGTTRENYVQVGVSGLDAGGSGANNNFHDCYHSTLGPITASYVPTVSDIPADHVFYTNNDVTTVEVANTHRQKYNEFLTTCHQNSPFVETWTGSKYITNYDLRTAPYDEAGVYASKGLHCINKGGSEDVLADKDITDDITGADRTQDCTVDKGAYEYNGALSIAPELDNQENPTVATYYVTPNGRGLASGQNPANAACAAKLQKVLDAAGRYKYEHNSVEVIVKVANNHSMYAASPSANFTYYATRTTAAEDNGDARQWSIIVPRGVEVWGGYSDEYTSSINHGFLTRDITGNPTYFDATYSSRQEKTNVMTYHVLTFTDKVYDVDGRVTANVIPEAAGRAVVDGIFISGGNANMAGSTGEGANIDQYGGAAIVTPFAHVRNCIVRNNSGTYGGALALMDHALVSGCLIDQNRADYGGAVYVFKDGTALSDGKTVDTSDEKTADGTATLPHIFTSTLANNTASKQGGGIWFDDEKDNVRINSSLVWRNNCSEAANVYGLTNPTIKGTCTVKFYYPFAYSAVENSRMPGVENIEINTSNSCGTRFLHYNSGYADADKFTLSSDENMDDVGYYKPSLLSALLSNGMPIEIYRNNLPSGMPDADILGGKRIGANHRRLDIGAVARERQVPTKALMTRIYVCKPEDVNVSAATALAKLQVKQDPSEAEKYYSQQGASFAYPFQSLQEALSYIVGTRQYDAMTSEAKTKYACFEHADKVPFEIIVAKGTYYPSQNIANKPAEVLSNTFAIPEGVSIYGGFDVYKEGTTNFYGGYNKIVGTPDSSATGHFFIENNLEQNGFGTSVSIDGKTIHQCAISDMLASRETADINNNSIIEPWEFKNATILDGNTTNAQGQGVYHVLTIVPDRNVVGKLPPAIIHAGSQGTPVFDAGKTPQDYGQYVRLNGLTIQNGRAQDFFDADLDEISKYNYSTGGALLVDGNRYNNYDPETATDDDKVTKYKNDNMSNAVAFRDIPMSIINCRFYNNKAAKGGAISSNGETHIFGCTFEKNLAEGGSETITKDGADISVRYAGQGGAIYSTFQVTAFNSVFANNEARDDKYSLDLQKFTTYRNPDANSLNGGLAGCGGAMFSGKNGRFHLLNCNFVRNKANVYPALFTMNPNYYDGIVAMQNMAMLNYNQAENCVFWGNEVNENMTISSDERFAASMFCNYGKTDRSSAYNVAFSDGNYPTLAEMTADKANSNVTARKWCETAWFCAYEDGKGSPQTNGNDLRKYPHFPNKHALYTLGHCYADYDASGNGVGEPYPYQNCNITISSDNIANDGPHFGSPSAMAGVDGYGEDADWSPVRLNPMTDAGSGLLVQNGGGTFNKYSAAPARSIYSGSTNENETSATNAAGFTVERKGDYENQGTYTTARFYGRYRDYQSYVPLGDESYMKGVSTGASLPRISYSSNAAEQYAYIDIGAYEYAHTSLNPTTAGDMDVLWVSTREKYANGEADGSSWAQPTSDVQLAIETLLANRNGHAKTIKMIEGEYAPMYRVNNQLAYCIDTKAVNLKATGTDDSGCVTSLTIEGGYSDEFENQLDLLENKTVVNGQIVIADATQRYKLASYSDENGNGWWTSSTQSTKPQPKTIPIVLNGLRVVNNEAAADAEGAAIKYADQTFTVNATTYNAVAPEGSAKKLTLSRSVVYGSGKAGEPNTGSAIYVGTHGGEALLYNNVLHSNYGNPLKADGTVAVNNTIALNYGQVVMTGASRLLNNVMWRNNPTTETPATASSYGNQFTLAGFVADNQGDLFKHNAYTRTDDPRDNVNGNVRLYNRNEDVTVGPNFVDPTNEDISLRNFEIRPNVLLVNKGNTELYTGHVSANAADDFDAVGNDRTVGTIDIGAYELQKTANRIFYVDPNKPFEGDGQSWQTAMGYGELQTAVDMAAMYVQTNGTKQAYVLVKSAKAVNKEMHMGEELVMRNGVNVIGTVNPQYQTNCTKTAADYTDYTDDEVSAYMKELMLLHRNGTMETNKGQCRITGINGRGVQFGTTLESLVDGFVVMPLDEASATVTAPVVDVDPDNATRADVGNLGLKVCLKNIVVRDHVMDNTAFTDANKQHLVYVNNALLYGVFMHNNTVKGATEAQNKTAPVLKVGKYGYVVNATVEGKTTGADGSVSENNVTLGDKIRGNSVVSHVLNSLTNFGNTEQKYFVKDYSPVVVDDAERGYQLADVSPAVDAVAVPVGSGPLDGTVVSETLGSFINYHPVWDNENNCYASADVDIMGNFRLQTLGGVSGKRGSDDYIPRIDRGAFETWKVVRDVECISPDYPHAGSSVYVMSGYSLTIDKVEGSDPASAEAFNPGFLLVQQGGGLYGNGRKVTIANVALERMVSKDGEVMSLPFDHVYTGGTVYTYNADRRSKWDYGFSATDSKCWEQVEPGAVIPANQGVLFVPTATEGAGWTDADINAGRKLMRFVTTGADANDYVYTETVDPYKTLTLKQNDDWTSTNGGADFTSKEDMGWNCIGLPYLVSGYSTMAKATTADHGSSHNGKYMMNIPHTMWLYYNGKTYADGTTVANGDGGFYGVSSWNSSDWHLAAGETAGIWAGEGIFMQTSSVNGDETVTFYRPVPPVLNGGAGAPAYRKANARYYVLDEEPGKGGLQDGLSVCVEGRAVTVSGLAGGESVRACDASGRLCHKAVTTEEAYTFMLPHAGIYVINVDGRGVKVVVE